MRFRPSLNLALGYRFYYARQYAQAIEQCQKVLAMDPQIRYRRTCTWGGPISRSRHLPEAIAEFRKALEISEGDTNELAALGQAYAVSHRRRGAPILDQLRSDRSRPTCSPCGLR